MVWTGCISACRGGKGERHQEQGESAADAASHGTSTVELNWEAESDCNLSAGCDDV